jgi:Transposase protein
LLTQRENDFQSTLQEKEIEIKGMIQDYEEKLIKNNPRLITRNVLDVLNKKVIRPYRYTPAEIGTAISLLGLGPKAIKMIKNVLGYPMPSISTIQRYSRYIDIVEGI